MNRSISTKDRNRTRSQSTKESSAPRRSTSLSHRQSGDWSKKASIRRRLPGWRSYQGKQTQRLQQAIQQADLSAIARAIRDGAEINHRDQHRDWKTPLLMAISIYDPSNDRTLEVIESRRWCLRSLAALPLHALTIRLGPTTRQILLRAKADGDCQDVMGNSALHTAAHFGHVDVVHLLLQYQVDCHRLNNQAENALFTAVRQNQAACVRLFVKRLPQMLPEVPQEQRLLGLCLQSCQYDTLEDILRAYKLAAPNDMDHILNALQRKQPDNTRLAHLINSMRNQQPSDMAATNNNHQHLNTSTDLDQLGPLQPSKPSRPPAEDRRRRSSLLAAQWLVPTALTVRRGADGLLGFSVVGGIEQDALPAIALSDAHSPHYEGQGYQLREGDELLAVDGHPVAGLSHAGVVDLFRQCESRVSLLILPLEADEQDYNTGNTGAQQGMRERSGTQASLRSVTQQQPLLFYDASVPLTTRTPEAGEVQGQTYHFVSPQLFHFFLANKHLAEWGQYLDHYYGSLKRSIEVRPQHKSRQAATSAIKICHLTRNAENVFGFGIHGGTDHRNLPFIAHIADVAYAPSSPNRIAHGDAILRINDESTLTWSSEQCVQAITSSLNVLTLVCMTRTANTEAFALPSPPPEDVPTNVRTISPSKVVSANSTPRNQSPAVPVLLDAQADQARASPGPRAHRPSGGGSSRRRSGMASSEATPASASDGYEPVRLTRKILEQRNLSYLIAANEALGDGSVRTESDIAAWTRRVLESNQQMDQVMNKTEDKVPHETRERASDQHRPKRTASGRKRSSDAAVAPAQPASAAQPLQDDGNNDAEATASLPPAATVLRMLGDQGETDTDQAENAGSNSAATPRAVVELQQHGARNPQRSQASFDEQSNDVFRQRSSTVTSTRARVGSVNHHQQHRLASLGSRAASLDPNVDPSPVPEDSPEPSVVLVQDRRSSASTLSETQRQQQQKQLSSEEQAQEAQSCGEQHINVQRASKSSTGSTSANACDPKPEATQLPQAPYNEPIPAPVTVAVVVEPITTTLSLAQATAQPLNESPARLLPRHAGEDIAIKTEAVFESPSQVIKPVEDNSAVDEAALEDMKMMQHIGRAGSAASLKRQQHELEAAAESDGSPTKSSAGEPDASASAASSASGALESSPAAAAVAGATGLKRGAEWLAATTDSEDGSDTGSDADDGYMQITHGNEKVDAILQHLQSKLDAEGGLQTEFSRLQSVGLRHKSCATQANRDKNRYRNITAYDHSRVVLQVNPEEGGCDYYNANYIAGARSPSDYIACQGPTNSSVDDFWRMVWQQKTQCIVMVTNLEEQGRMKCLKYWPDLAPGVSADDLRADELPKLQLGPYVVFFKERHEHKLWTQRVFELEHEGEGRMTVTQFHMTAWPDHGVPSEPSDLLYFRQAIRAAFPNPTSPMLVHCSAGVGRSGTFIAIDHMLQLILDEARAASDVPDVRDVVHGMRDRRNFMVQTEEQYIFIYFALEMALTAMQATDKADLKMALDEFHQHTAA
ncbi:uncharacterized protein MONBRDRAFT_25873 [Monosiga brevicollis MX1]|uniref:Protein-tyrosine-phosphatase n=1 Tax=Monosiga brevicollis TaxID=81824 RepID=A9V0Q7_MONBE|nr:uncharacterized protein MONBRDRAFT_25873 [Monosiga brevicollis MX1]EDQ88679.1 predicted protein [Monosiga brevicollis MX1]|eukprot:XP_001746292.1 hypothetical protein [Monosiga brevicollis MX1]